MFSLARCSFPQQRRRSSKNWPCFAVDIILIVSPSLSTADQQVSNYYELSSHPTVPFDVLSSSSTLASATSSRLEDCDSASANSISQMDPITYQNLQSSRLRQMYLQAPNVIISSRENSYHRGSPSSQPSSSTLTHSEPLPSFLRSPTYEEPSIDPKAQQMLLGVQVGHLIKRQQLDTSSSLTQYFPQPFDTSLGTEFESDTCQPFMSKFLNNPSFQDCHPFSLLLTTSDAFFRAYSALNSASGGAEQLKATTTMSVKRVLDASCKAEVDKCNMLFNELAVSINSTTIGCGEDLLKQNSLSLQALEGLKNYRLMREVACLTTSEGQQVRNGANDRENRTSASRSTQNSTNSTLNSTQLSPQYCFEKAVLSSKPDDLYYYYLPLGTSLPSGTQSSCDRCIRSMMKLYSNHVFNKSLPISSTYMSARTMTNAECGPGFAPLPINLSNRLASTADRCSRFLLFEFTSWMFLILYFVFFRF